MARVIAKPPKAYDIETVCDWLNERSTDHLTVQPKLDGWAAVAINGELRSRAGLLLATRLPDYPGEVLGEWFRATDEFLAYDVRGGTLESAAIAGFRVAHGIEMPKSVVVEYLKTCVSRHGWRDAHGLPTDGRVLVDGMDRLAVKFV